MFMKAKEDTGMRKPVGRFERERPVMRGRASIPLRLASWLAAGVLASVAGVCGCQARSDAQAPASSVKAEPVPRKAPPYAALAGKWQRPDGGYLLHVKSVAEDGVLDASYFNPSPIHIATSQASRVNGSLKVFVELRDENYPGSTYRLTYDPADDRLKGTYYQAVAQETYEIFFVRLKP